MYKARADAWNAARAIEVRELGPDVLRHLAKCIPLSNFYFGFTVDGDGRIKDFNDAGGFGQIGPDPSEAAGLKRIQDTLETDTRCNVFPTNLRHRVVTVTFDNESKLHVSQVRPEDVH